MIPLKIDGYAFEIRQKRIKHIYFRVYHSQKKIVVSAPVDIHPHTLKNAILSKKEWLEKQVLIKQNLDKSIETQAPNKNFPYGDTILYLGNACPVETRYAAGQSRIRVKDDGHIQLYVKPGVQNPQIEGILDAWYRKELKCLIRKWINKWEPVLGVDIREFGVKKMKTRWGSCNINASRIWLNFSLIQVEEKFIEYVVVHEMVHLLERSHNKRFRTFMDQFIPDWRSLKKQLNLFSL